jgi:ankyrin repeat protein
MEALIEHGADVNYVSKRWCTPLHGALRIGNEEKLRLLLDYDADSGIAYPGSQRSASECAKEDGKMHLFKIMDAALRQRAY